MHRILAIIERDLRRFRRSPTLLVISMVMPLVQLVVLGYAFGGKVKNLQVGVVDQDHGVPANQLKEMFQAVAANAKTFETIAYADEGRALRDLREGRISGVVTIPPQFSRKLHAGASPRLALVEDNTDQFASNALEGSLTGLLQAYNKRDLQPRMSANAILSVVEVYPYVHYIQYLLPGTIVLAIFVSAMIGGGIIYIDDKARGLHEGYLVAPISKFELILGFTLAGAIKAIVTGVVLITLGSIIAGIPDPLNPTPGANDGARGDHVPGTHQHDVPADGQGERSVGAPSRLRRFEYVAFLPKRRGLSHGGFSRLDESDHGHRPVHLRRARLQGTRPEEYQPCRHPAGFGIPFRILRVGYGCGHAPVPPDVVKRGGNRAELAVRGR